MQLYRAVVLKVKLASGMALYKAILHFVKSVLTTTPSAQFLSPKGF